MGQTGRNIRVIMGGGRRNLTPAKIRDVEEDKKGYRRDGKDLIELWKKDKENIKASHEYVWNKDQLLSLDLLNTQYLLGLFAWSHMDYALDREYQNDPTLEEMTRAAITVLQNDRSG